MVNISKNALLLSFGLFLAQTQEIKPLEGLTDKVVNLAELAAKTILSDIGVAHTVDLHPTVFAQIGAALRLYGYTRAMDFIILSFGQEISADLLVETPQHKKSNLQKMHEWFENVLIAPFTEEIIFTFIPQLMIKIYEENYGKNSLISNSISILASSAFALSHRNYTGSSFFNPYKVAMFSSCLLGHRYLKNRKISNYATFFTHAINNAVAQATL